MSDPYRRVSDAYSKWGQGPIDQRRLEGDVLLGAASRLEAARREWRPESGRALEAALLHNRKVWTIFASGAADEASALPPELRDNVISIAIFVFRRSLQVLARPEPGMVDSLIEINRCIAAGLLARAAVGTAPGGELLSPVASNETA